MLPDQEPRKKAIFSICSNNYLSVANVFYESALDHAKEADLFLCLADTIDGAASGYPAGVKVIASSEIGIPQFECFAFRYDIMEFNTAVKPYMILHLFSLGYDEVVYFDPDIVIYRPLRSIFDPLAAGASVVLTPHLLRPNEGPFQPDDTGIMRAGTFNLGFIALRRCQESVALVRWWARKLERDCVNAVGRGIFVDQKYMDLAPGFCDHLHVSRDPSLNVAYWNLQQRSVARGADGGYTVDGVPLTFFHFSGFSPAKPNRLSKHTQFASDGIEAPLCEITADYCDRIERLSSGLRPNARYAYERFESGAPIPLAARRLFRERFPDWPGNPFEDFEDILYERAPGYVTHSNAFEITNLIAYIHETSPWLAANIDIHSRQGQERLVEWYLEHGESIGIDLRIVQHTAARVGPYRRRIDGAASPADEAARRRVDREANRNTDIADRKGSDLTVVGYLTTETGVGEIARQTLSSFASTDLTSNGYDVGLNVAAPRLDRRLARSLSDQIDGRLQVYVINADQLPLVVEATKEDVWRDGYKVSIPFWELSKFPDAWRASFDAMDEVWVLSRFVQLSIARRVGKPVLYMPPPLYQLAQPSAPGMRGELNIDDQHFVFFFAFDCLSFATRKNPLGVIKAFRAAVEGNARYDRARLLLKVGNIEYASKELKDALAQAGERVQVITKRLPREQLTGLMSEIDCVMSLHRSEGLGLLVAEGMSHAKPVISTDYSATTDFLDFATGYPIGYKLVQVREGEYPHHAGQFWADPDLDQAAWTIRHILDHSEEAQAIGEAGRAHLARNFSPAEAKRRMLDRARDLVG